MVAPRLEKTAEEELGLIERYILPRGGFIGTTESPFLGSAPLELIRRDEASADGFCLTSADYKQLTYQEAKKKSQAHSRHVKNWVERTKRNVCIL